MKVHFITHGCSNNQAESQIMAASLEKAGFEFSEEKDADLIIVNTCSVKGKTESKTLHEITELQKQYPNKKLIIAGCLPEADLKKVERFAPTASIVSTNHISKIGQAALSNEQLVFVGKNNEEKVNVPKIRANPVVDIVPLSNGCLSNCTFCSTKLAKGDLTSFDEQKIISEIRNAKIGGGAKEFWLTSQDNGCYGFEHKTNAARLLKNIIFSVSGEYFLRFGMANPQHLKIFLDELIEVYRDSHIFKFIHVPVQSGSNNVLSGMARGHTVEDYKNIVAAFRRALPETTIWTDLIVGFPTETEEDFAASLNILKETQPDLVNISSYSVRPGTKAAKMKQLSTETKKDRTRIMSQLAEEIYLTKNNNWLGWEGTVIVDEYNSAKNSFIGRNQAYKPVVIRGVVELGQIVDIKIVDFTSTYLIGETQ